MATVGEIVRKTTEFFSSKGGIAKSGSARLDSELLIARALGWERLQVYLKHDFALSDEQLENCRALVRRRAKGEPVAYILGEKGFYKQTFQVTPATLIPRPETEMLVIRGLEILSEKITSPTVRLKSAIQIEIAKALTKRQNAEAAVAREEAINEAKSRGVDDDEIKRLFPDLSLVSDLETSSEAAPPESVQTSAQSEITIVDLGCGSGCIGLSIIDELKTRAKVHLVLVDLSPAAIDVARTNAKRLGVDQFCEFIVADAGDDAALAAYVGRADLVVANPPYIDPSDSRVEASVREFEPASALFAGEPGQMGMKEIARWAKVARKISRGAALFEIGDQQGLEAQRSFAEAGWLKVRIARDLSDRERMVEATGV